MVLRTVIPRSADCDNYAPRQPRLPASHGLELKHRKDFFGAAKLIFVGKALKHLHQYQVPYQELRMSQSFQGIGLRR